MSLGYAKRCVEIYTTKKLASNYGSKAWRIDVRKGNYLVNQLGM